jgi:hypothetical protein
MMGYPYTHISAAPVGDANGYYDGDMKAGAYAPLVSVPTFGARHVTMTRTVVNAADTPGVMNIVGTDPGGSTITETITPGAHGVLVTGTRYFASITSITNVGWVLGAAAADTIVIGWDDMNAVAVGSGTFHAIHVNTTAAGTITIADASGTIAVLPANVAVGFYGPYDVGWSGVLRVEPVAASDITVIHSGSLPSGYALS